MPVYRSIAFSFQPFAASENSELFRSEHTLVMFTRTNPFSGEKFILVNNRVKSAAQELRKEVGLSS